MCLFWGINVVVTDDADKKAVGYVCLWESKFTASKYLRLLKSCYHMVGGKSELSLSKYKCIRMETVHDKN